MKYQRLIGASAAGAAAVMITFGAVATFAGGPPAASAAQPGRPAPCSTPSPGPSQPPPPVTPTTITTLEQAYYCIFDNYYSGPVLDDRTLLTSAFSAFTKELRTLGLDQSNATMPALTGRKDKDWDTFAAVYTAVSNRLPADPIAQQKLASATMHGMVNSLQDDHAQWGHDPVPGSPFGMNLSSIPGDYQANPLAKDPLFVTSLLPGSPALTAGVKPGDEIVTVNGVPPFVNGQLSQGVLDWLHNPKAPVQVAFRRPKDNSTFTVTLDPAAPPPGNGSGAPQPPGSGAASLPPPPPRPQVTYRLLPGNVAYVQMPNFFHGMADQVLAAIAALRKTADLKGVTLDLRGNTGGDPPETAKLLGAWVHGRVWTYWCDVNGNCDPQHTDDSVALVHLPLVTLIDEGCASACDAFASTVKDLHLGKLVGTRTAGVVSGPGQDWLLNDNSMLSLPQKHALMANKEILSGIGVAPDYQAPFTSTALSAGHDPAIDKAVSLLTRDK